MFRESLEVELKNTEKNRKKNGHLVRLCFLFCSFFNEVSLFFQFVDLDSCKIKAFIRNSLVQPCKSGNFRCFFLWLNFIHWFYISSIKSWMKQGWRFEPNAFWPARSRSLEMEIVKITQLPTQFRLFFSRKRLFIGEVWAIKKN